MLFNKSFFTKSFVKISRCHYSSLSSAARSRRLSTLAINREESTASSSSSSSSSTSSKHNEQNPLLTLKSIATTFDLCDDNGFRKDNRHWTFALSIVDNTSSKSNLVYTPENENDKNSKTAKKDVMKKAPILRTVNFQRVSEKGIDFVMKNRGYASDLLFLKDQRVSFLYTIGQYLPGQTIQQWRSQGICQPIRLKEIIHHVPTFTIVEMVASVRANKEGDSRADMDISHFTEIVQQTREELDRGDVSMMELEEAVRGWRFVPDQMEQMIGGPEQVMWERHEWLRDYGQAGDDKDCKWVKPVRLMPF